jgi:uncharacterized membrane protein
MAQTARKRGPATKATSASSSRTQRRRAASDNGAAPKTATGAKKAPAKTAKTAKTATKTAKTATKVAKAATPNRVGRKLLALAIRRAARGAMRGVGSMAVAGARAASRGIKSLEPMLARARTLPIQRSVDVAVPIDVAWAEWEQLGFLPEGTHRVSDVERDDDGYLVGRVRGLHVERDWEAEILDEREAESFAWRSVGGSDVSGLVTFHPIADRLTRVELHLDVIPSSVTETLELVTRIADRRAETELRRFKAHVETLDPDEYSDLEDEVEEEED